MRQTPLFSIHQDAQALMSPFAGWHMPLHYGSQLNEHQAVRSHAGIFDVSHMRVCDVTGPDTMAFCQYVLANDVAKCQQQRALYSCMLNQDGGVIDDLIVYNLSEQHLRLVCNAGHEEAVKSWLTEQKKNFDCDLQWSDDLAILAIQGPKARELVESCVPTPLGAALPDMKPFQFAMADGWMMATTGYTGEQGVEIILPAAEAEGCWTACVAAGCTPCGLAARDGLRLEAGYCLSGQDMDPEHSPWVSALGWTVSMGSERDFIGRDALLAQKDAGALEQLVGVVLEGRGVLRSGQSLFDENGDKGVITSGGFSPILSAGIGLARVPHTVKKGDVLQVQMRARVMTVKVVKPPFVKHGQKNV